MKRRTQQAPQEYSRNGRWITGPAAGSRAQLALDKRHRGNRYVIDRILLRSLIDSEDRAGARCNRVLGSSGEYRVLGRIDERPPSPDFCRRWLIDRVETAPLAPGGLVFTLGHAGEAGAP
jgi:hypothetical protein